VTEVGSVNTKDTWLGNKTGLFYSFHTARH